MAWQNPGFGWLHAARDAGATAITANNAFASDAPKDFLIDDRAGALTSFASSESNHWLAIDRGSGTLEAINHLYIPAGHNFDGANIRVRADDTLPMSAPITTILASTAITGSDAISLSMTSNTQRYVVFDWPSSTGQWELPELLYTNLKTPTQGPRVRYADETRHPVQIAETQTGARYVLSVGADQRAYDVTWEQVRLEADRTILDDLIAAVGLSKPFLFRPPQNADDDLYAHFERSPERDEEADVQARFPRPTYRLRIEKHLA